MDAVKNRTNILFNDEKSSFFYKVCIGLICYFCRKIEKTMYYQVATPSNPLKQYVNCYWVVKEIGSKIIREVNSTTKIVVCFHLAEAACYSVSSYELANAPVDSYIKMVSKDALSASSVIIGPHRNMMVEFHKGRMYTLGIEFNTGLSKLFLGRKIINIAGRSNRLIIAM